MPWWLNVQWNINAIHDFLSVSQSQSVTNHPARIGKPTASSTMSTTLTDATASGSEFHDLPSQVGGHPGLLESEDGSLIIKPCLPTERVFYELLAQNDPRLEHLQPFVPRFYGTLKLEGVLEEGATLTEAAVTKSSMEPGTVLVPHEEGKDECNESCLMAISCYT